MEDLLTYINQYKNGQNDESTNQEYIKKIIYLFFFITLSRDGNSLIYLLRILDIFDYSLKIYNDTSLDGILKKLIIVAVSDNGYCFDTIIEYINQNQNDNKIKVLFDDIIRNHTYILYASVADCGYIVTKILDYIQQNNSLLGIDQDFIFKTIT